MRASRATSGGAACASPSTTSPASPSSRPRTTASACGPSPPTAHSPPVCRAGFAGRGTALARSTERHTLVSDSDPRQGLGSVAPRGGCAGARPPRPRRGARRQAVAARALRARRGHGRRALHGLRPLDRVPAHGRDPRLLPPSPPRPAPAARRRARRPLRHPLPARRDALAGGLPDLPPAPLHLPQRHPGRAGAEGDTAGTRVDEPLHTLPVRLLPLEPRARPPALGGTLLPGPRRLRRLPARADGDVPCLPAALRAASRAALLRLPVRRHLRRARRPRVPRAALLRYAGDRRRGAVELRALALPHPQRAPSARLRLGAPPPRSAVLRRHRRRRAPRARLRPVRLHACRRRAQGDREHRRALAVRVSPAAARRARLADLAGLPLLR